MLSEKFSIAGSLAILSIMDVLKTGHHLGRTRYAAGWKGARRGRYMPHQGPRECARRVRQVERTAAKTAGRG